MRTFSSTADWVTSALMDLEPRVFDSRLNSCIMKSRRRPQAPPFFMILLVSLMCISRRSSSSATSIFWASSTISCSMRAGSSSTLASARRSVSFWRCHSMICGRWARTLVTSTWMPARRCSISALRLAPSLAREARKSSRVRSKPPISSVATASMSCSAAAMTPGHRSTSTGLSWPWPASFITQLALSMMSLASSSLIWSWLAAAWAASKRRLHSTLPRCSLARKRSRSTGSRLRSCSGRRM